MVSPSARCSSHAVDGNIKRMSNSANYCVDEVKDFTKYFRTIPRHFQLSGKSTCLLNNALEALYMKEVHMMTWCPTRMLNLLTCATQSVVLIFPLCVVLSSCAIKEEERDYSMSPKSLIILHLLADLETEFVPKFLRRLDGDNTLIMEVFGASKKFLDGLDDFKTPLTDNFIAGLSMSDVGDVVYEKETENGMHHIILHGSARTRDEACICWMRSICWL